MITCVETGPVVAGPVANVPAAAAGAAEIAAAMAPATNSGFMGFNFANIPAAYHTYARVKPLKKDRAQPVEQRRMT